MSLAIKLISTDFDGTLFADFENPPIPLKLQRLLGDMQRRGAKWVINTGRDLPSLMHELNRPGLEVKPDFLVLVEREIYVRQHSEYSGIVEWNNACTLAHGELFHRVRNDVPELTAWVRSRFNATIYEDSYSPFCFIAETTSDAELIHEYLDGYCQSIPNLTVVRNNIYARLSHQAYNKGSALAEIGRRLGISRDQILAAGDHLNDLPMLCRTRARWLVAPDNAIEIVKATVSKQEGFVSRLSHGHGIADGLEFYLMQAAKGSIAFEA